MTVNIKTSSGRAALAPNPDGFYWMKVSTGQYLGYRKTGDETGTFWARYRDKASGKQHHKSLGELGELQPSKRYDEAMRLALAFFKDGQVGLVEHAKTVMDACKAYLKTKASESGQKCADLEGAKLTRLVYPDPISSIELMDLRREHVLAWRQRVVDTPAKITRHKKMGVAQAFKPRSPSTVNRDMAPLRASLNKAHGAGWVPTDIAWKDALKPIPNVTGVRDLYLDIEQRRNFVAHASDEFKPFLKVLAMLPLRPGALAQLLVGDYDNRTKTLKIGKDKAGKDRKILMPPTMQPVLVGLTQNRPKDAPLLPRSNGVAWNKDSWKGPIKDAAKAAGMPAGTVAYSLRHSTITDLVVSRLDLLTIAQISGTSVAMIEQHYGHLRQDAAAAALASLAL